LGEQVKVEVADTGVGIPAEEISHIFDDFYRGDIIRITQDLGREAKGAGLGLSVSRKIVESHGGRIWAESPNPDTDCGSRITFVLSKSPRESPPEHQESGAAADPQTR
jgi:signal transduction histidine kinase